MPEMPMMPMSTRNCRMKSTAAPPTMPRSRPRTTPPATTTSCVGLPQSTVATFRLFVITRRLLRLSSACATASVVVPMLISSELPSGTSRATASAMRCLA